MTVTDGRVATSRRWGAWAGLTIVLALALRAYLLGRSWFWQDDFVVGDRALQTPLTPEWLLQDYSGHLMPAYFFQSWVGMRLAPMSWEAAAGVVLLWTAAFGVAFWFLATAVVGRGPAALVATGLATLTPLWSVTSSWFSSAMQSLPTLTLGVVAAGCAVRLVRSGSARWGVLSVVAYAASLLWFEKAVLGLLLIGMAVLGVALAGRAPRLRSRASALTAVALVAVTGGYLVAFLRLVGVPEQAATEGTDVMRLAYEMGLSVIPTGLVGGPWQQNTDGSTLQVLVTQPWLLWIWCVVVVVAGVAWRRDSLTGLLGVVAVIGMTTVLVWLVARARIDFLGPAIGRDTRYSVDVVPVAALALALGIAGGRRRPQPRLGRAARRALVLGAPAAVALYAAVAWPSVYSVAESRASSGTEQWVSTAVAQVAEWPGRVLVDGAVPARVVVPAFGESARASRVLAPFGVPGGRFGLPATQWWRFDDTGRMEPAVFVPTGGGEVGSVPACGLAVRGAPVRVPVPTFDPQGGTGVPTLRLGYYVGDDTTVLLESGEDRWELDLPRGVGIAYLPLDSLGGGLVVGGLGPDDALCLTEVRVGVAG